jgi:hypothetical protein
VKEWYFHFVDVIISSCVMWSASVRNAPDPLFSRLEHIYARTKRKTMDMHVDPWLREVACSHCAVHPANQFLELRQAIELAMAMTRPYRDRIAEEA